jgi:hypothetical protein
MDAYLGEVNMSARKIRDPLEGSPRELSPNLGDERGQAAAA